MDSTNDNSLTRKCSQTKCYCSQPQPNVKVDKKSYYPDETLERLNSIDTFKFSTVGKVLN